jgi:hypothetical protein
MSSASKHFFMEVCGGLVTEQSRLLNAGKWQREKGGVAAE